MSKEQNERVLKRLKLFPNLSDALSKLDQEIIDDLVDDAMSQAQADGFTESNIVRGATYLAAHFCNLASATGSNISKQQASVLTIEYFDRGGSDDYLVEYNRLKNSLKQSSIRFM
ncbi:hypothetical protein H5S09_04185 [Limosilactobacillus sp. STM2_1]|uniref:DUF4054 domain-containing protein n=1 Tax=Limosilactobacillus rudii TaxID=2759755 RepID=A0A7W3YNB9_9LACO|nr:hypothetical protein [Limosilactobacillus rudii]MBB1078961.1 hypothetical protein [Limosilactobacillus rudii]MBB1097142.1 hypothetical protein [Limosilactobacillus rudii]MCD7134135.1 hypothetical protein [Limosilactobacillus rudii]